MSRVTAGLRGAQVVACTVIVAELAVGAWLVARTLVSVGTANALGLVFLVYALFLWGCWAVCADTCRWLTWRTVRRLQRRG